MAGAISINNTQKESFSLPFNSINNAHCVVNDVSLADYSGKDQAWDTHRSQAQDVQYIYSSAVEFERYADRIGKCSGVLRFGQEIDPETGEVHLKLRDTFFCRVRHCPVCQWRRSLMWKARFYQALPEIEAQYPKSRWIFLTLTVSNCPVNELKEAIQSMNKAWQRFIKRKEFKLILGFIRTTEVTQEKKRTGYANPHFHVLLMVPPSMFGKDYITQARWTEIWQDCLRVAYTPMVDVRAVRNRDMSDPRTGLQRAVAETLKYSVKPADMVNDPDWFLEMNRQVHKMRFVATGGVLKDVLRVDEETQEELILITDDSESKLDDGKRLAFNWRSNERKYRRFPKAD